MSILYSLSNEGTNAFFNIYAYYQINNYFTKKQRDYQLFSHKLYVFLKFIMLLVNPLSIELFENCYVYITYLIYMDQYLRLIHSIWNIFLKEHFNYKLSINT